MKFLLRLLFRLHSMSVERRMKRERQNAFLSADWERMPWDFKVDWYAKQRGVPRLFRRKSDLQPPK